MKRYRLLRVVLAGMFLGLFLSGTAWSYSITLGYDSIWSTYLSTSYTYDEPSVATATAAPDEFTATYSTVSLQAVSRELDEAVNETPTNGYIENGTGDTNGAPAPVPEPSTLILLGAGLIGAAMLRKRMS
ncbi:MAG: PEP-CTERM sorting domain-containing protein [Desulfuromonadales bacterium]|nr:PEP-CTERM sorting domain-containing protein [Desulfuromonadales bacterium]MDW7757787.1 PEP-CTERM sorting domain-containing protein [Desulfuromonadales bacterium]